jgi:hypothetical protein
MPTIIELRLKATWTVRADTRLLHGLACALFEGEGAIHDEPHKPWAAWPLRPGPAPEAWEWRTTWLPDTPPPATVVTAGELRVGHVGCTVTESRHRRVSHASLAGGPPLTAAAVTFASPTYFSRNGTDTVTPDPRLIAGSWRRRWNASLPADSPLVIGDDAWLAMHKSLALAEFDLRTERRDTGHGRDRPGFTGTAAIRLPRNAPPPARKILGTLARFAPYCGTGAQTTHGFGATTTHSQDGGSS